MLVALTLLCPGPALYAKDKSARITVLVRNEQGEPVDRAAVIVKPMRGKHVKGSYELRTTQQGTAPLPPLHQGTFLVQVIAKGYQTHGEQYTVNEREKTIEITLKPPQDQFSVHKPASK